MGKWWNQKKKQRLIGSVPLGTRLVCSMISRHLKIWWRQLAGCQAAKIRNAPSIRSWNKYAANIITNNFDRFEVRDGNVARKNGLIARGRTNELQKVRRTSIGLSLRSSRFFLAYFELAKVRTRFVDICSTLPSYCTPWRRRSHTRWGADLRGGWRLRWWIRSSQV